MNQSPESDIDQTASQLLEKLTAVRKAKADAPESDRRGAFERTLDEELSGRPADTAKRVVAAVRERLIAEARARDSRGAQMDAEVAQLRGQLEAAQAERDRLVQEVRQLKESAASPASASASSEALERVREALFKTSGGQKVDAESIGVSPAEARLFHLVQELLNFALVYEQGVNVLLQSLQIGPGMDTQQLKGMKEEVRERFRACLENKEGSVKALQAALEKKKSFRVCSTAPDPY
jgi:hypothetical protein